MKDRILNFSYEKISPIGIYEKVLATPKSSGEPCYNVDTLEVCALKQLIKKQGMPRPNIYRGTHISYSNKLNNYPSLSWVYYYRPEMHAFPIIINTHQVRHLFKYGSYEEKHLLEHPNQTELLLTKSINEKGEVYSLSVYKTCIGHYPGTHKTYDYYIVKKTINADGKCYYSHPIFIKPYEFDAIKMDNTKLKEFVDRFF